MLLLYACATNAPVADPQLLDFIQDGTTTRDEILLNLGQPSAVFQDEAILTYRIGEDKRGYFIEVPSVSDWQFVRYSLVLVFDAKGTLQRHNLVSVR